MPAGTPQFRNLLFEDCEFVPYSKGVAAFLQGLPEAPVQGVVFRNVSFRPSSGSADVKWGVCEHVEGVCEGGTKRESCPPCFSMSAPPF